MIPAGISCSPRTRRSRRARIVALMALSDKNDVAEVPDCLLRVIHYPAFPVPDDAGDCLAFLIADGTDHRRPFILAADALVSYSLRPL